MNQVFSGIQPSGIIHIGNYIGAIKNWVKIQHQYPSIFCIVDLHAMTIKYEINELSKTVYNAVITNLACGLDPNACKIFIQSSVKDHTELTWILTTITPFGDLTRMTQFKDKSAQHQDNINAGLFSYPILMAADILLYKANIVPVGEDQIQHLELTREIARRFNSAFGPVFPEPKELLTETPKILGLDGKAKMSKSLNNYIALEETKETLWEKLRGAKTDENRVKRNDPGDPKKCNIFTLHKNFSAQNEIQQIAADCCSATIGCVDCKKILNLNLLVFLSPIQEKIAYYREHMDDVKDILAEGTRHCTALAANTMSDVFNATGQKY
jgi:tryptophanyl-tRNA synthetase